MTRLGRVLPTLFVGISYAWWMNKHTRHHGNPNQIGKDPDIALGSIASPSRTRVASSRSAPAG